MMVPVKSFPGFISCDAIDTPPNVALLLSEDGKSTHVSFYDEMLQRWTMPSPSALTPEVVEAKRLKYFESRYSIYRGEPINIPSFANQGDRIPMLASERGEQRLRDMIEAGAADLPIHLNIEVAECANTDRLQLEALGKGIINRHIIADKGISEESSFTSMLRRDYSYLLAEHKIALAELDKSEKVINDFRLIVDNRNNEIEALKIEVGSLSKIGLESDVIKKLRLELSDANEKAGYLQHENRAYHHQANEACARELEATKDLKHVRHQMRLLLKAVYGASAVMAVAAFIHFAFGV